jgi:hypothetical protein
LHVEHRAYGTGLVGTAGEGPHPSRLPSVDDPGPPAGWYDDPGGSGLLRLWDGTLWTDETRPRLTVPLSPSAATADRELHEGAGTKRPSVLLSVVAGAFALGYPLVVVSHVGLRVVAPFLLVSLSVTYVASRQRNADFSLTVGHYERHRVRYRRSNWSGRVRVDVDGAPVVRKWVLLGFPLEKTYHFTVGTTERHNVDVVKTRPLFLAWLRPQPVDVYVDGFPVASHSLAALKSS